MISARSMLEQLRSIDAHQALEAALRASDVAAIRTAMADGERKLGAHRGVAHGDVFFDDRHELVKCQRCTARCHGSRALRDQWAGEHVCTRSDGAG